MKRMTVPARIGATFLLAPAVLVLAGGPALAADGVVVSNLETVQAHLDADGTVRDARIYEQLALKGKGIVTIDNPISTDNLRNLDGFGAFDVTGGRMTSTQSVAGETRLRAVSDYDKRLPLKVSVTYKLDGKPVEAGDVVGRSGRLEVRYKVENVTGRNQDVTFDDGSGKQVTQSANVFIPMVGSLTTVLPPNFVDVTSSEANMAGDGHGQTKMSFTMTLFGPIGSPIAEFGYSAAITGGLIPAATISALPVSPLDSPSFKGGAASYKGGAETGAQLTAGASEIDANVLKLRDGAQSLMAGLIQLRAGAQELNTGLADEAAPGANELAGGSLLLKDGAGQLKDGLGEASAKAPDLLDGLGQVADGLELVDGGLVQLYGGIGRLPAKAQPIHDGIQKLLAGLGNTAANGTLINGVDTLRQQIAAAGPGLQKMEDGVFGTGGTSAYEQLGCAVKVIGDLNSGAAPAASDPCYGGPRPPLSVEVDPIKKAVLSTLARQLAAGRARLADPGNLSPDIDQPLPAGATLQQGLAYLRGRLTQRAVPGLVRVECGLDALSLGSDSSSPCYSATDADPTTAGVQHFRPGLRQGLPAVDAGVSQLVNGVVAQVQGAVGRDGDLAPTQNTLRGGVHAVTGGIDLIGEGGLTLLDGMDRLSAGANQLSDGTVELSTGANKLAAGLGDAATGSGQLADGLAKAANGGKALPEGASRLSAEGTSKLVEAGRSTAADYGLKYAVIVAGAERAKTQAMAYGAPADATGTTAYSLEISGANGDGGTSIGRAIGALALFGAGSGLALFRRRRV